MTRFNQKRVGLFAKLIIGFLIVIVVGAVITTWLIRRATKEELEVYTTAIGRGQAERLSAALTGYYLANGSWDGVETFLATTAGATHSAGSGQVGPRSGNRRGEGQQLGQQGSGEISAGTDIWQVIGSQILLADSDGRVVVDPAGEFQGLELSEDNLANGVPVSANGQHVGTVLVTSTVQSSEQNEEFIQKVDQAILVAVLTASIIAFLIGGLISWQVIKPLRQLTVAAQAIAGGDLEQKVEVAPGDEIGDLAIAFNQMSTRLSRSEALRRQMTADIAHELRTPLTVIQGNVEALQDGVFPLTIEALDPIHDKTKLLSRLVEDLRQLTLAETGQLPLDKQPIDLQRLATHTISAFQATAEAKSISLTLESESSLPTVNADAQRLEQVLGNLLSNAMRYTPEEGSITVTQRRQGSDVITAVNDSGTGIPAEALPNVFERFYRVDQGRAREPDGSGSGLGLAVARSIIVAHGGEIGVNSQPGEGATFWFTLPTA